MKFNIALSTLFVISLFYSCEQSKTSDNSKSNIGMTKVTILYPNGEGKNFDMDYYANKHMPMISSLFGESLKLLEIDKGVSGRTPDDPIPYLAIGYLYFDNISDYQTSFGKNADRILGDIQNYTNIQPIVQISEVYQ